MKRNPKFKNVLNLNEYFQQSRNGLPLATASAMVTTEQYHQKLEETADRVKAVFDAISTYTKALDDIPHKVFKDQLWSVSGRCDEAAGANGFNVTLNAQLVADVEAIAAAFKGATSGMPVTA